MAKTPQPSKTPSINGPTPEVTKSTAPKTDNTPKSERIALPFEPESEEPIARSESFDAAVWEIRRLYGSNLVFVSSRLEDPIRRRLGLDPLSVRALALAGLVGFGIRLALVLLATALVGEWTGIPWGRWAAILVLYGAFDATQPLRTQPLDVPLRPNPKRWLERMTPLLPTVVRESDLRDLAAFARSWLRLPVVVLVGVGVTAVMLGTGWLFAPAGMEELPAGSIVLLAFLLYDFGALMVFGGLNEWALAARQARYDHDLFWPSPADSLEVRKAMQMWGLKSLVPWMTVNLVLAVFLVSWDSPLVLPLAVGFIVIGYLVTIGAAFATRAAIRKIVERIRHQRLQGLQIRIDAFGPRYTDLSKEESEQLRELLFLHDRIRHAPASPSTANTVARTAAGLLLPTIAFVITVFGEVSAERLLDAILP